MRWYGATSGAAANGSDPSVPEAENADWQALLGGARDTARTGGDRFMLTTSGRQRI